MTPKEIVSFMNKMVLRLRLRPLCHIPGGTGCPKGGNLRLVALLPVNQESNPLEVICRSHEREHGDMIEHEDVILLSDNACPECTHGSDDDPMVDVAACAGATSTDAAGASAGGATSRR